MVHLPSTPSHKKTVERAGETRGTGAVEESFFTPPLVRP